MGGGGEGVSFCFLLNRCLVSHLMYMTDVFGSSPRKTTACFARILKLHLDTFKTIHNNMAVDLWNQCLDKKG